MPFTLVNDRNQAVLASHIEMATTARQRLTGLLGRRALAPETGLLLAPCGAVHTAFMRFAIDVVFIDGDGRAVKVVRRLKPWRIAMSLRARAVIELGAGTLGDGEVQPGDRMYVAPAQQRDPMAARIPPAARHGSHRRPTGSDGRAGEASAC